MAFQRRAGGFCRAVQDWQSLFTNVKRFGEDVAVPKNPEQEGSPRLISISEIAVEHGVSRVSIHTYRRRGDFPQPVSGEGTTRLRWRADEVAAWFAANPKQPGKKRAAPPQQQGGQPVVYTLTMRIEADEEIDAARIREEIYEACRDVPFGFDVTTVEPEASDG